MGVNFINITDRENTRTFHVKSDNEEIILGNNTNDIIKKLDESFLFNYQKEEEILTNGSNYIFESVDVLNIHFHNIKLKRDSSYIDSPDLIKNKKATINPKNANDNNCLQYSIIAALHHRHIGNYPKRISKLKPCINSYDWEDINFPAGIKDWKKFEGNNKDIALNILSAPPNTEKINIIYKSEHNHKPKNQVVLSMITDNNQEDAPDKWHYLALKSEITDDGYKKPTKSISRSFRGITSNNNGDFYCLSCLHSFRTDNALRKHERLCNNHKYCNVVMPAKVKNIFTYNHGEKSLKVAHVIYMDLECLFIKTQSSQNNPEESYTERSAIHEACDYLIDLVTSYDPDKNRHIFYRGKYCTKKLCKDLKEQAMEVINFEE